MFFISRSFFSRKFIVKAAGFSDTRVILVKHIQENFSLDLFGIDKNFTFSGRQKLYFISIDKERKADEGAS